LSKHRSPDVSFLVVNPPLRQMWRHI